MTQRTAVCLLICATLLTACGGDAPSAREPSAHPETLDALARAINDARDQGRSERLYDLVFHCYPTPDDLRAVLREGPATDAFVEAMQLKPLRRDDEAALKGLAAMLFVRGKPEQTEAQAHSATTEVLVDADRPPGVDEFPGGMGRFAREVAAPGRTWWTVELLEPGHDSGMRYSCFTRLGNRWIVIPKPWRHLPRDPGDSQGASGD